MNRQQRRQQRNSAPIKSQQGLQAKRLEKKISEKPTVSILGETYEIFSYTQQNWVDIVSAVMNPETGELELADFDTLANAASTIARQVIPTVGTEVIDTNPRGEFIFTIHEANKLIVFLAALATAYYVHFATEAERENAEFNLDTIQAEIEAVQADYI